MCFCVMVIILLTLLKLFINYYHDNQRHQGEECGWEGGKGRGRERDREREREREREGERGQTM